jgi:DNA-binding SARP family transcriptional activator
MDVRCRIELLGELRVLQGERTHTRFRTHKAASLLAYLALFLRQTHPREQLLEVFWPEMDSEAGRNNLSTALSQLRAQLEPTGIPAGSVLVTDRQQVRLHQATVSTDTAEFEGRIQSASRSADPVEQSENLERAVALYKGDLLPGNYEDWALREQSRLQTLYTDALRRLGRLREAAGRYDEALSTLQRASDIAPFEEDLYRDRMRICATLQRPAAALEIYQTLETRFRDELGIGPSAQTREIAERLRQNPGSLLPTIPLPLPSPPAPTPPISATSATSAMPTASETAAATDALFRARRGFDGSAESSANARNALSNTARCGRDGKNAPQHRTRSPPCRRLPEPGLFCAARGPT